LLIEKKEEKKATTWVVSVEEALRKDFKME
jgi:hypothetical protein